MVKGRRKKVSLSRFLAVLLTGCALPGGIIHSLDGGSNFCTIFSIIDKVRKKCVQCLGTAIRHLILPGFPGLKTAWETWAVTSYFSNRRNGAFGVVAATPALRRKIRLIYEIPVSYKRRCCLLYRLPISYKTQLVGSQSLICSFPVLACRTAGTTDEAYHVLHYREWS